MADVVVGVVDCPGLRMYADFLGRRGYLIRSFSKEPPESGCAVLIFCSDHLSDESIQRIGGQFQGHKLILNAPPPEDWINTRSLSLPLLPLELEQQISSLTEDKQVQEGNALHILVVEDDVTAAMTLVRSFQEGGFSVKVCRGYAELATAIQTRPDLIVMDLNLPGVSGEKLGEMIRRQNIPVVIFSSEDRERLEEARKRIGAIACFPKGTSQRTMREWIRNYLQKLKA